MSLRLPKVASFTLLAGEPEPRLTPGVEPAKLLDIAGECSDVAPSPPPPFTGRADSGERAPCAGEGVLRASRGLMLPVTVSCSSHVRGVSVRLPPGDGVLCSRSVPSLAAATGEETNAETSEFSLLSNVRVSCARTGKGSEGREGRAECDR